MVKLYSGISESAVRKFKEKSNEYSKRLLLNTRNEITQNNKRKIRELIKEIEQSSNLDSYLDTLKYFLNANQSIIGLDDKLKYSIGSTQNFIELFIEEVDIYKKEKNRQEIERQLDIVLKNLNEYGHKINNIINEIDKSPNLIDSITELSSINDLEKLITSYQDNSSHLNQLLISYKENDGKEYRIIYPSIKYSYNFIKDLYRKVFLAKQSNVKNQDKISNEVLEKLTILEEVLPELLEDTRLSKSIKNQILEEINPEDLSEEFKMQKDKEIYLKKLNILNDSIDSLNSLHYEILNEHINYLNEKPLIKAFIRREKYIAELARKITILKTDISKFTLRFKTRYNCDINSLLDANVQINNPLYVNKYDDFITLYNQMIIETENAIISLYNQKNSNEIRIKDFNNQIDELIKFIESLQSAINNHLSLAANLYHVNINETLKKVQTNKDVIRNVLLQINNLELENKMPLAGEKVEEEHFEEKEEEKAVEMIKPKEITNEELKEAGLSLIIEANKEDNKNSNLTVKDVLLNSSNINNDDIDSIIDKLIAKNVISSTDDKVDTIKITIEQFLKQVIGENYQIVLSNRNLNISNSQKLKTKRTLGTIRKNANLTNILLLKKGLKIRQNKQISAKLTNLKAKLNIVKQNNQNEIEESRKLA